MATRTHRDDDPVRITTAATSRSAQIAQRQRRYLYSMALRTACVIGAVVAGPGAFRWVLVAGAVFLPYVAVVMANVPVGRDTTPLEEVTQQRPQLPSAPPPN